MFCCISLGFSFSFFFFKNEVILFIHFSKCNDFSLFRDYFIYLYS